MEAFQLREDLAVTNAKLQAIEEIDPAESTAGTAFRPEDGMNAYLEKYMEKSHRTEEQISEISGKQQSYSDISAGFRGSGSST